MTGTSDLNFTQGITLVNTLSSKHLALWWRGVIESKAKQIKVLSPSLYNLFDYYYVQGWRDTQSLPYLFANTDCQDFNAILKFSECFGLIGKETFSERAAPVILNNKRFEGERFTQNVEERISQNTEDLIRHLPVNRGNFSHARSAYIKLFQRTQNKLHKTLSRIETAESNADARHMLPKRLTKWRHMRPELAWDNQNKCWATIWHLPSLEAGIYLMLHIDLQRGGLIRSCRRDDCAKWFRTRHTVITFCSLRCQNTNQIRQYRERKKEKTKSAMGSEMR